MSELIKETAQKAADAVKQSFSPRPPAPIVTCPTTNPKAAADKTISSKSGYLPKVNHKE